MKQKPKLKKGLGQHLLVSPGVLFKIAEFAEVSPYDAIVEIGPGTGNLTEEILKKDPKRLYLLEIDKEMIAHLEDRYDSMLKNRKIILIKADAGKFDYSLIPEEEIKVLGNLPYNRASLIVERVVFYFKKIPLAVFMVQKEVAERWMKVESWLSVFIQGFYRVEYLMTVPPRFFVPRPKVDSAVIRLKRNPKADVEELDNYKGFLVKLFANPRKVLRAKLPTQVLEKANISPLARAEELLLEDFIRLYRLSRSEGILPKTVPA